MTIYVLLTHTDNVTTLINNIEYRQHVIRVMSKIAIKD